MSDACVITEMRLAEGEQLVTTAAPPGVEVRAYREGNILRVTVADHRGIASWHLTAEECSNMGRVREVLAMLERCLDAPD